MFLPENVNVDLGLAQASLRIDQLDGVSFAREVYPLALDVQTLRQQLGAWTGHTSSSRRADGGYHTCVRFSDSPAVRFR